METKKSRYFTLMIMPDSSTLEVRRVRVSRRLVKAGGAFVIALALVSAGALVHAAYSWQQARENEALRKENDTLRSKVAGLDERLAEIDGIVDRVKQFDTKLRTLTMVSDPERHLAIGPVGGHDEVAAARVEPDLRSDLLGSATRSVELVRTRADGTAEILTDTEKSVSSLSAYLQDQKAILSSTPSRAPARGFISSTFGMRIDPFTGLPQLHAGIDFSANVGARVSATADGLVIFAANDPAYGLMVKLDHGAGLVTQYAHMSSLGVKVGDQVKRGQLIGAVGNTGRSTGPHLHYEVRINGVPVDPRRFLLDLNGMPSGGGGS